MSSKAHGVLAASSLPMWMCSRHIPSSGARLLQVVDVVTFTRTEVRSHDDQVCQMSLDVMSVCTWCSNDAIRQCSKCAPAPWSGM